MRRLMFLLVAASFLGTMVGCSTCGSGCGLGSGGCSSGACGSGGGRTHSHGICDCDTDDYCSSRSPWIRYGSQSAPTSVPITEVIPATPAKVLPKGDMKL